MNEDLKYSFSNVNDWLKFAESKNAGLFALNVAAIIGILQINENVFNVWPILKGLLVLFFSLSSAICIINIQPQINAYFRGNKKMSNQTFTQKKDSLNSLFFGHIAMLSTNQFIELMKAKDSNFEPTPLDIDLAQQIVNNSEIANEKYIIFNYACWLSLIGFLVTIATVVIIGFS